MNRQLRQTVLLNILSCCHWQQVRFLLRCRLAYEVLVNEPAAQANRFA